MKIILSLIFSIQTEFSEKPMCLPIGAQCTSIYDTCCSTGTFCSPNAICP